MTEYKVKIPQHMMDEYDRLSPEEAGNYRHGVLLDYIDSQVPMKKPSYRTYQGNMDMGDFTVTDEEVTFSTSPPKLIK